ncbi:MAG: heavy metal translocating P-type ATPase, partial [Chryseobacterium sp.]|nr:heavy metal translocating P-type ATPase [Chryseobacterium sp.]
MAKNKLHTHIYDENGRQLCCTPQEGKIYKDAGAEELIEDGCCRVTDKAYRPVTKKTTPAAEHSDDDGHDHGNEHADDDGHDHSTQGKSPFQLFLPGIISFILLIAGLAMDYWLPQSWFKDWVRIAWYTAAYLPVGLPVLKEALESIMKGDVFSEFFLMSIATVGAFAIGEYPEGVAVMLFYSVGEVFQTLAVQRAKGNIAKLLDQRLDEVTI